jgi:hypothetical protein
MKLKPPSIENLNRAPLWPGRVLLFDSQLNSKLIYGAGEKPECDDGLREQVVVDEVVCE